MARLAQRRSQNIAGDLYVDSTCIDCDTCRWMAPEVFHEDGDQSSVHHQPVNDQERLKAFQALLACPTASIGTVEKPVGIKAAQESFPLLIAKNVYHCGYHSEKSYGAASYFIQRPQGNIMIDSPRFTAPLVQKIEQMGGIHTLYLTHQDDVADHEKFHDHFGCERVLHQDDIHRNTQQIENQISGIDPVFLDPELMIIPVPGHTKGHTVLLYKDQFLFTGDHLAWSLELDQLYAFRNACWYSWSEQAKSMKKLLDYSFEWILPGHGRRYHADRETMSQQMHLCVAWMSGSR